MCTGASFQCYTQVHNREPYIHECSCVQHWTLVPMDMLLKTITGCKISALSSKRDQLVDGANHYTS